ncbi:hypothetical protein KUTeg_018395 [Tegillarca granosa]|uniref:Protein kinase domain-containing protein n=1 Tax=Tegillarca granosa TaxID=220873 RepID=A0ABQ9EMK3_TEGGR|nr:hypothetical protein KUTeg_018395 [Tegillarca granosa]
MDYKNIICKVDFKLKEEKKVKDVRKRSCDQRMDTKNYQEQGKVDERLSTGHTEVVCQMSCYKLPRPEKNRILEINVVFCKLPRPETIEYLDIYVVSCICLDSKHWDILIQRIMADRFPSGSKTVQEGGYFQVDPRFIDLRPLGYGGNGVAIDNECEKAVSIKKLNFIDRKGCKYALREIRLMRRLQHENIITIYEILGPNGYRIDRNSNLNTNELRCLYLVQELLDTDLYQLIQNQPFSEEHNKLFLYQLLRGLKYIHSANVVHRDLKPANLLINVEDYVLKITDFGLARVKRGNKQTLLFSGFLTDGVGTCWYRSPELILSPRDYTKAIDMWSVGCIFAEMLIGKPLFPGGNEMDQIGRILDALHFTDNEWNTLTQILPQSVLRNRSKTPKSPLNQKFKDCNPLVRLI